MNEVLDAREGTAVDQGTAWRLERQIYREARLLDEEAWDEWLALMCEDIHYWMPAVENRRRADRLAAWEPGRGAYFDDTLRELAIRIARFKQAKKNSSRWPESPTWILRPRHAPASCARK